MSVSTPKSLASLPESDIKSHFQQFLSDSDASKDDFILFCRYLVEECQNVDLLQSFFFNKAKKQCFTRKKQKHQEIRTRNAFLNKESADDLQNVEDMEGDLVYMRCRIICECCMGRLMMLEEQDAEG